MNEISQFLSNTDLSAKDTIIISIVSAVIACFIIFILAKLSYPILIYIKKKCQKHIDKIKYLIRLHNGRLKTKDYSYIEKLIDNGKPISKLEQQRYDKFRKDMAEQLKNINFKLPNFTNLDNMVTRFKNR